MYKLIALALVAAVTCNDLIQGPEGGRKIFDEEKEASPAIWKQMDQITVHANVTDVISRVVITDRRPGKDGEAKITDGGPGQNNVTIELKSPTVFRGYNFHVEVYVSEKIQPDGQEPLYPEEPVNTEMPSMENDTIVNPYAKAERAPKETDEQELLNTKVTEKPVTDTETVASVVPNVNENKTEDAMAPKSLPLMSHKHIGELSYDERFKILHPTLFSRDDDESKDNSDEDIHSTTEKVVSTSAGVSTTSATTQKKTYGEDTKSLGDVSKEIGEHVVLGFKHV